MADQSSAAASSPLGDISAESIVAAAGGASLDAGVGGGAPAGAAGAKAAVPSPVQSLDFILDIPLKVTVELGRAKMAIREILQLAQGSVVELSKFAGEPLEVLVNEKLIARGEVVVVNEKFGIRLTDIISPVERIEQLK
jgi:flagellar motor switch protein FliN/FliY